MNLPIADALAQGKGVCQDFAYVMIAVVRNLGIPWRYTMATPRTTDHARAPSRPGWKPGCPATGWVGFEPTNDLLAQERHIRTAVGRGYADVPPIRGVFNGDATTAMAVAVSVSDHMPPELAELVLPDEQSFPRDVLALSADNAQMKGWRRERELQQQQQQ